MAEPKIVATKVTQPGTDPAPKRSGAGPRPDGPAPSRARPDRATSPEAKAPRATRPPSAPAADEGRRGLHPAWFGALLIVGGLMVWSSIRGGGDARVPEVWNEATGPSGPTDEMQSALRPAGPTQGSLLRLEWPSHPNAESYRIQFLDSRGLGPAPVPVQSTVFMYDMRSNVLNLPSEFEWVVVAILPDGSEIVTPPRRYP